MSEIQSADSTSTADLDPRDFITDSGPLYHEFHFDSIVREPWNAYSSLFFLVPVAFWLWKLRGQYKKYYMITLIMPLLFLNGVGSTLYHAFRSSELALLLDWVPAQVMNLFISWYMWNKVLKRPFISVLAVLLFISGAILITIYLGPALGEMAGNLGYFMIGMCLLAPALIYLFRTGFYNWHLLALTFLCVGLALVFRSLDYPTPNPWPELMPQGTHFLWHITSAMAMFSLGYYFKYDRDRAAMA